MRSLFLLTALLAAFTGFTQATYNKFQWSPVPALHTIDKKYEQSSAVFIADDRTNEYIIEKDGFYFYRTLHRIVHLNNDKGIEAFNKIYLPFEEGVEIVDVKARTILPGGQVMELDRKNIKDLKDDEGQYKIFALEGLTKGCEVEYYYTVKSAPSFFGREVISSSVPCIKGEFKLISPEHLVFEAKTYNQLPEPEISTSNEKRYLVIKNIQAEEAEEEKYSMYKASLKRVEYKLCYNKAKNETERLFTWNELAKKVHAIYTDVDDKAKKKISELLSEINPKGSTVDKIMAIENYVKKNFVTRDDISAQDGADLGKVIKNKVASHSALCKLFTGLYAAAGIDFQIVLAGNRSTYTVDQRFENWDNAQNFLIYFPATKKFICPTETEYRYPWIPPTWAATNGLFCVATTIGSFTTALAEVRNIPMEDVQHNYLNLRMSLKMDSNDSLQVEVKQLYAGYAASNYKMPFVYMPAEEQRNVLKQLIKFGTNSENILSHSFENREMEMSDPYKPFVINASVKSTGLVERAGEKLLLKIGELIGEQAEMYEAKPRSTDIDIQFPHVMERIIEFTIPDGYTAKNLDDLTINEVYKDGESETMGFVSTYAIEGNKLKVTIKESYNRVFYPRQQYDHFKKVINAAADFNKVVLILSRT